MESKKVKPENTGLRVTGLVFAPLGALLFTLGLLLGWAIEPILLICLGSVGALFLILGVVFLEISGRKTRLQQQAVNEGRYVWGRVQGFQQDCSVYVNGRCPVRVLVEVMGSDGITHVYRSNANWKLSPMEGMIGRQVKVYGPELQHPYVDVSPLEQNLINHF